MAFCCSAECSRNICKGKNAGDEVPTATCEDKPEVVDMSNLVDSNHWRGNLAPLGEDVDDYDQRSSFLQSFLLSPKTPPGAPRTPPAAPPKTPPGAPKSPSGTPKSPSGPKSPGADRAGGTPVSTQKASGGLEGDNAAGCSHYVSYDDGSTYIGQILDGKRHGHGIWKGRTGQYEGQWVEDQQHGKGYQTWDDGRVYEGQFLARKFHGSGRMVWTTQKGIQVYDGQYKDDLKHGQGKFVWADGRMYDGQWSKGRRHGKGVYTNSKGERRQGTWTHDKFDSVETRSEKSEKSEVPGEFSQTPQRPSTQSDPPQRPQTRGGGSKPSSPNASSSKQ